MKKNKRPASISEFIDELAGSQPTDKPAPVYSEDSQKVTSSNQNKPILDNQQINSDDTVMIGDSIPQHNVNPEKVGKTINIDDIEFVDLGLSVKWANMNIGAKREDEAGIFFTRIMDGNLNDLYQWNTKGAVVPSIEQFKELITKCRWYWGNIHNSMGYTIVGPNGNSISFPVTGDGLTYPGNNLVTFGLLWTNEALLNEWRTHSMLLYYNSANHNLTNYSTNKMCPIRLILN